MSGEATLEKEGSKTRKAEGDEASVSVTVVFLTERQTAEIANRGFVYFWQTEG